MGGPGPPYEMPKRFLKPLSLKPWVMTPSSVTTTGRRTSCGYSRSSSFHSGSEAAPLRLSGSCRQVVDDLLISDSKPPACRAHSTRVSRSEEHTSELQSLMRISYAVFCLNKKNKR